MSFILYLFSYPNQSSVAGMREFIDGPLPSFEDVAFWISVRIVAMSPSCMCVVPLLMPMDCSFNVALWSPFWRIIWFQPVSFPMAASVLIFPQNPFFLYPLSFDHGALYGVVAAYPLSQQHDIQIHVKMVATTGASMERQWWWHAPSFEQEPGVHWWFSLRFMDGILHMRAKCWRRPWCALSMVHDQSQIGLYVHWIVAHGGYGMAAEWSLHPCVLPYLSLPLEDAAYSLWISGVHGSLEDTMEILWKLGCGPLKSCCYGDACAWSGCLQSGCLFYLQVVPP